MLNEKLPLSQANENRRCGRTHNEAYSGRASRADAERSGRRDMLLPHLFLRFKSCFGFVSTWLLLILISNFVPAKFDGSQRGLFLGFAVVKRPTEGLPIIIGDFGVDIFFRVVHQI